MDTAAEKTTLAGILDQLTRNADLDKVAAFVDGIVAKAFGGNDEVREFLEGEYLTGTPLHPALVHFPIGAAFSAALLDLIGLRAAAGVVTGLTAATAVPTALTGFAEYTELDDAAEKRVGGAHYLAAASGSALVTLSLASRLLGQRGLARTTLWGACAAFAAAGALGGHLVYGLDVPDDEDEPAGENEATPITVAGAPADLG